MRNYGEDEATTPKMKDDRHVHRRVGTIRGSGDPRLRVHNQGSRSGVGVTGNCGRDLSVGSGGRSELKPISPLKVK
jgi:hypothetical protein